MIGAWFRRAAGPMDWGNPAAHSVPAPLPIFRLGTSMLGYAMNRLYSNKTVGPQLQPPPADCRFRAVPEIEVPDIEVPEVGVTQIGVTQIGVSGISTAGTMLFPDGVHAWPSPIRSPGRAPW
jgi:hypothetical protein